MLVKDRARTGRDDSAGRRRRRVPTARLPGTRRRLRKIYNALNEARSEASEFSEEDVNRLNQFFIVHNEELRILLRENFGDIQFPKWLSEFGD